MSSDDRRPIRVRPHAPTPIDLVVADRSWIVERLAREIAGALPEQEFDCAIVDAPTGQAALTYFLPYSAWQPVEGSVTGAWFTHQEMIEPAKSRFVDVALAADFALTPAKRYETLLREAGVQWVEHIHHGVDIDVFRPALTLGVVGRTYHTGRKGEALLAPLLGMPDVALRFTGTGWPLRGSQLDEADLARFYREIDYLLIPSTIEGGPVPLFEALASGCEVIASDVGCVEEFPHIPFEKGNAEDLARVVRDLLAPRLARRETVAPLTWQAFGAAHGAIFRKALARNAAAIRPRDTHRSVYLVSHGTEDKNKGGPTTRMAGIAAHCRAVGDEVRTLHAGRGAVMPPRHNGLAHVFNSWPLGTSVETLGRLGQNGTKRVFSPIALNLQHRPFFEDALIPILHSARSETELAMALETVHQHTPPWEPGQPAPAEGVTGHFDALRAGVAKADHCIFLSAYEQAFLEAIGARPNAATIVHNGVDAETMAKGDPALFRDAYGLSDFVLVCGRIEPRKNQAIVAHALRDIDCPVVFIGHVANSDYQAAIEKWAGPNLHMIDRIDDRQMLASAYKAAAMLVLTSWAEGAPLAALEAGCAGTPLILSNMSGEQEYFGTWADYLHPADIAALRAIVAKKLAAPETPEQRSARQNAMVRFDIAAHADATRKVYNQVSAPPPGKPRSEAANGLILDLTHLAHHLCRTDILTGVPGVEYEIASRLSQSEPVPAAVIWNSPNRAFVGVEITDALTGGASKLATTDAPAMDTAADPVILTETNFRKPSELAEEKQRATRAERSAKRAAFTLFKETIGALPGPVHRATVRAIQVAKPNFSPVVFPEHAILTKPRALPPAPAPAPNHAPPHPAQMHAPATPVASFEFGETFVRLTRTARPRSAPPPAGATTLVVLGQPWISNDRQLQDLIAYATRHNLALRPLIHDILYVTDTSAFDRATREPFRRRLRQLLAASDLAYVTSPGEADDLKAYCEMEGLRLELRQLPLGLTTRLMEATPAPVRSEAPDRFIFYVSSINGRKDHEFLIDVWDSLYPDLARNNRIETPGLVLIGKPQGRFENFNDPGEQAALRERGIYLFTDVTDAELASFYRKALFTVYPSRREGWGLPPLESLAFGTPCVASATLPSIQDVANGGLIRLPPGDFFGWRATLWSMLTSPGLLTAMAKETAAFEPPSWDAAIRELRA